jgi:dipeptidyl aminopeptidase/acylaminoacyl peptidase
MQRVVGALAWRAGAVCALALASMSGSFAAAPRIPIEQFAAGAEMEAPRISPDGTHLVYISTSSGIRLVMLRDLQSGQTHQVLRGTSGSFRATLCDFKTDNRLLCHFEGVQRGGGARPFPASRLVAFNRDGNGVRVLLQDSLLRGEPVAFAQYQDRIVHWLPDDPHHVLIELAYNGVFPSVYRLDVDSGALRLVVPAHPPVVTWIADHAGVVRFGYGFRDQTAVYVARNGPDAPWRTLEKFKRFERARFEPLAFGALPNQLFVFAPQQRRAAVWEMDIGENSDFRLVFSQPEVDVEALIEWPTDWHVAGFQYETDRRHTFYIDPQAQAIDRELERARPGAYHLVIDASRNGGKLVAMSTSDVAPPRYDLLDAATHELTPIGEQNRVLSQAQLAPMQPVSVPGPGGITIPGYLTLPVGTERGQRLPAVVFPHGGPYARDSWGYDPLLQLMVNRGYAVLQLNFRGSSGYGEEWKDAGHQAWGGIMNDDVTAGARWLVDQKIADPASMCIVGWSYGGYAALIGVEKQPELYRCAVSIAGVSDMLQLARDDERFYGGREAALESTGADKAELQAESPILHASRIRVPVLLVHGEDDTTVLAQHSHDMARALSRSAVPNELVLIKEGEHSLLRPDMRLALYRALEAFLSANLEQR